LGFGFQGIETPKKVGTWEVEYFKKNGDEVTSKTEDK
jgi:hypothetical protein